MSSLDTVPTIAASPPAETADRLATAAPPKDQDLPVDVFAAIDRVLDAVDDTRLMLQLAIILGGFYAVFIAVWALVTRIRVMPRP